MKILFYGRLAEAIAPEIELDSAADCTIAELRRRLAADHPAAATSLASKRALACVSGSLVRDEYVVASGEDVEFLPPVSGG